MTGTAVFRMVVSSDCMKKATATSQGKNRLTASMEMAEGGGLAAAAGAATAVAIFFAMPENITPEG